MKCFIKVKKAFFVFPALLLAATAVSCASTGNKPVKPLPFPYSFAENSENSAYVHFDKGDAAAGRYSFVDLISFEDKNAPKSQEGIYWNPIRFPTGKELDIMVDVYYRYGASDRASGLVGILVGAAIDKSSEVDTKVHFKCNPLENGKNYKLAFEKSNGANALVLTEAGTGKVVQVHKFSVKKK